MMVWVLELENQKLCAYVSYLKPWLDIGKQISEELFFFPILPAYSYHPVNPYLGISSLIRWKLS